MSAARVAKLEVLLERVRQRATIARVASVAAVPAPVAAKPATVPPPRRVSEAPEDVSDVAEYVDDVEEVVESEQVIAAAPPPVPTEDEMMVEVSTEEVDIDDPPSGEIATSETHVRTASDNPRGVLEVSDESVPDVATPGTESETEYEAPRHTPPPASGSMRAAPEETHDPSGQWGPSAAAEDTGVRSSARLSTRPSVPPASTRQPSAAPPPASGKHPSVTPPVASAPSELSPVVTSVTLTGPVVASRNTLPSYVAVGFDELLRDTLDL